MAYCLVTGHKGFIGGNVFWKLRNNGYDVTGLDRKMLGGNIVTSNILLEEEFDLIIHCAANLFSDFDKNIEATKYLIEKQPQAKFIFMSSAAVYGNTMGAKVGDKLNPFGEYGKAKVTEEELIREHSDKNVILRLSNVYGYGTDHGVYQNFIDGGNRINCPFNIRDFVNVSVVVKQIISAIKFNHHGTFNVSSGEGTKIKDLFYKLNPNKNYILSGHKPDEIEYSILL